jgi:signal transduction histidine kinase
MATMSHELRTPLNAIINVPQGLLDDFPELAAAVCHACDARVLLDQGEELKPDLCCPECRGEGTLAAETRTKYTGEPAHTARFLRKIERSGKHLLRMVNEVLDFSKMQANRLELARQQVDVETLLRETLDEMNELAQQRQLALELEKSGDGATLWADPLRLKQVLLNLLSNAIKFSEPRGTITVHWCCQRERDVISVTDQGIGIAREHQERIFGSFEQVHTGDTRKYGGTGLGLSISRSLVRMHGGDIWVESREGQGSTFSFSIPRAATN